MFAIALDPTYLYYHLRCFPVTEPKKKTRLELLKEWKLQRQQTENNCKKQKKPPFHAGKIQKTATGSPKLVLTNLTNIASSDTKRMTTRSQAKAGKDENGSTVSLKTTKKPKPLPYVLHQLNKVQNKTLVPVKKHVFAVPKAVAALPRLTIPNSPKITKSARKAPKPIVEEPPVVEKQDNLILANKAFPDIIHKKPHMCFDNNSRNVMESVAPPEVTSAGPPEPVAIEVVMDTIKIEGPQSLETGDVPNKCKYSPDDLPRPVSEFEHLSYSPYIEKRRGSCRISRGRSRKLSLFEKIEREIEKEDTVLRSKICSFRRVF